MNLNKILSSYTFRFNLVYIVILSIAVTIVLGIVYAMYSYQFTNEVHDNITSEFNQLVQSYEQGGAPAAREFIEQRAQQGNFSDYFYLLADTNNNKIAGNLNEWPELTRYPEGWLSFEIELLADNETTKRGGRDYVGLSLISQGGYKLLVARNYNDVIDHFRLVFGFLWRGMIIIIGLGAVGGAILSLLFLKRVESINRSVDNITAGNLSDRIPEVRAGGDFELLVRNFNSLLDRVESLMLGMKQQSDNIAHDLRTPLTRLRNHLTDLQHQVDGETETTVQSLIEEADGILGTFNALLRIARIESDKDRSAFREVNLNVLLHDVVELYEPLGAEKNQRVELSVLGEITMQADRDVLFQALANLVDNAIKYTPNDGLVRVVTRLDGGEVRIVVSDTGPGIPEAEREKAFRRFYRLEASRSLLPGNGLGLSLVAAVVQLHRGSISLEDNRPGLRVALRLPVN